MTSTLSFKLYKICSREAWSAAKQSGVLEPSLVDRRDGFVHLSSATQVAGTLAKHFAGQRDLVLLGVAPELFPQGALRWEVSRGGELFPHLYGELRAEYVTSEVPLRLAADGSHELPPL